MCDIATPCSPVFPLYSLEFASSATIDWLILTNCYHLVSSSLNNYARFMAKSLESRNSKAVNRPIAMNSPI